MGCLFSSCCFDVITPACRERHPWINECRYIPDSVKEQWKRDDANWRNVKYHEHILEENFKRVQNWGNTFEGQEARRKYDEEQTSANIRHGNTIMAQNWKNQHDEVFRHQQLLDAVNNLRH